MQSSPITRAILKSSFQNKFYLFFSAAYQAMLNDFYFQVRTGEPARTQKTC